MNCPVPNAAEAGSPARRGRYCFATGASSIWRTDVSHFGKVGRISGLPNANFPSAADIEEIGERLSFLEKVGPRLSIARPFGDTSPGGKRSGYALPRNSARTSGVVCYILDEPTIGLPPRTTSSSWKAWTSQNKRAIRSSWSSMTRRR